MARDLFQEAGFDPSSEDSGRDLFEEAGLTSGQDGKERKKRKSQATAADYLRAMDSGLAQGVAGIAGGIGTFIQDPAANALSGVSGAAAAADRGITWAANAISGKDISKENEAIQENARMASRFAAESRDAQAADPTNLPARFGRMLQRDSERANAEILASDKANNPELIAQQQNTAEAQGFVDNLAAIKDNPLAFAHTMARSAPDMAAGVGVGSVVHRAGASLGRVSTAGALSEASSSALQSRQGVYQQVNEMPLGMLAKSPRFQAVLAETQGDPAKAREILANELADQVPLLAGAGTALGTVLTNKLFGGDATAKTIAGVERMGIREFGKRVLQDTAEEGFQGVPEDAVQYGASVQADPSQQYDPGGSAAQNLAAGFAMGSGGHGLGYARDTFRGSNVQNQTPAENQQNQAPALSGQAQAATNSGAAAGVVAGRGSAGLEAVGVGDTAAAEEALKTPVQLTALDRADALGGELQAIAERQQELAPENGYGPAFDGERQDLATKAAELAAERDSIAATWPKAERGAMSSFTTEAGARLDAQYALMDAGDLVTSHDEGLAVNPLFPKELQPRDRSRQASELQVSGIVQRLDPARLGLSADAANGAPIVGADGLVESGNARTIALKRVYQANGQKAENYKQFLRDNAAQFGLAPEAIDAMAKPVLVRVRATPVNRAEFARQANASTVQRMSPSEQALSDAKRLNSLDGLNPDEQGDFGNNMDFVRQFMATLPVTEQSDLIESDGRLSTAGYRRIQNAVLARAYGDSPSLRRMTESMDNNLANISKALVRVAPTIAAARERMDAGTLHQADIAPDLLAAVEGLSALKEKGWKVSDELGQADLTGPKYSPEAAELLTFLSDNARSPRRIAEFFQRYYDALEHAGDPTQPSMFGDDGPAPTRASLINTAKETQNGNADQDPQRGVAGEGAQADARDGGQPQNAPRSEGRNQGNGPAQADAAGRQPGKPAQEAANDAVGEWVHFPEDSGTLGIPRSDMPQVKGEHRGALVNFLNARGISSTKDEVPASSLKPTQAEFSREKTERFMKTGPIGERSVLVSSDGHVLDGHHQWMAMKALGESIPVIRLDAPIRQLLDEVREFPSVQQSEGDKTPVGQRAAAVQDFKDALGDLAQIASKHTRAAMMPEKTPDLMPVLAKLFDAAIRLVGTDMKRATKWVREQIKADPRFKTFWNKISPEIYQKAALQAMEGMANPAQDGLFGDIGEAASAVQDDLFNSPAKATEATSAVSKIESKAYDRDRDNYRPPSAKTFLPAELIARANGYIGKYSKQPRPMVVAPKDRARAKAELKPLLDAALGAFQGFARNVAAVAQQSGALGQIVASVKNMDRAVEKYVDPDGADFSPERMRDLLRATVVVSSYGDVQAVVDAVVKVFGSVARVKTRISEDARIDGYADVLLNVVLPDGVAAEIQINVPQMLAAKDAQGHKLYEAQRVQPEASAAYKEIGDAMREFYDAAFAAAGNNLTLPVAANSRQPRAQFKKTASEIGAADRVGSDLTGSKSDPLSSSLKTLPSGSSTNSSPLNDATNSQPGGNLSGTFIGTPPASILRADAKNSEPEPAGAVRTATQIAADIAKAQPDGDVAALREQARDAIVAELGPQALDAMEPGSFMRADGLTQAIHDGQYEALREYAAAMPVPVQESDIPRDAATQAYSGTSHSPEQRGASARRNYVRALVDAWKQTEATLGDDAAARARAVDVLGDVVEGYRSRYLEALGASARVMSAMIAGPARFPVEANRKKSETADKRAQEASEFLRKGIARMAKAARGPIDNSPDSDVARIRANLEEREATQERMKAVNAALRKKDDAPLVALGYSPALIAELKKPDFAGRRGYADYKLANNNAEIRRLRERLAQAEQRVSEAAAGPVETTREGVRIEENAQDDRLRLFFDEKPGEAVRTDLKARGFKWSPNAGAWQRQLTDNARAAAERVLNDHYPKNDGKDVSKLSRSTSETGGMDFDALDALVSDIARKNPRMPKVNVLADPSKAPKALRDYITEQGAWDDVDGAMHDGELYLFASGLPDALRAEHVLAEHEAAHFGLRAILGDSLTQAMNLIYANNGAVRKAATEMQRRGKLSDAAAVEEVIVDLPSAQLARLKGWRKVAALARDWLASHGFTAMAGKIGTWLDGTLSDQQRADLFVADLVRGARAYVAGKGKESTGAKVAGTRLSATLADDLIDHNGGDKEYIVFRPEQIKSAIGNSGAFDSTSPDIRLSRAAPSQDAAARAEAIIQDKTGGARPLDAAAHMITRATGVERLTGAIYDKAANLLAAIVPEKIKAGVMSDYGLPEAVKDQRTMLQGRQRVQLRKAGSLIEKLATLTRAESRVAYEWMNMDGADPQAYVSMMQGLPEESVAVLQEVQTMIDRLSKDAVRLGQLDPEAFKRNRFAYLRRSYAKHTLEQTKGQKAKRARTIAVLGEQYKGRGLSETAAMSAIKNISPEWWERKLAKGKADTALKGEQLLRLERRAPSGTGTTPLPGMTGKQAGRVLEVAYWPASERLPAKYADWTQAGTWEVRDVKGPNAVLWRDFTKDEREQMGEIDEARFAIAKTLHAMIHDVEVGRYLDWLAMNQAKKEGETIPGEVVDASEKYRDTFAPGEWVRVPDSKIAGTNVLKYGKLAGRYVEGPVWNDLRQMAGGGFQPFGDTYNKVLNLWKTSKTALSPAVHMNNVMSNFVMADWHEVHAAHVSKALRIMLAASDKRGGIADRDAAREILNRYSDSGGDSGSWVTNEISRDQIEPLLASLEREMAATNGGNAETQTGVFAALQHALHLRFPAAFDAAAVSLPGKAVKVAGGALLDAYQAEDDVFRLGAWLAAKEQGATDLDAGKRARASFLDYNINAPWINAMRKSAWPFLSFTYRAVPMLLETVARKPHKLLKLMALAGGLNALGVMLAGAGGGDEDERKLLPEEKAGNVWGMVPKLIRMPWNDGHNSPVYLDIRRFIPVGDVFDIGQGQSAIPILPGLQPGGPLVVLAEIALNKSAFTGKPITLGTDTARQKAEKFLDHMYKAAAPNVLGVPGTYATTGVVGSLTGRTDAFGREMSTAQAVASSFGVKLGSYPPDVMRRNLMGKFGAEKMEIDKNISQYKRQLQTGRIGQEEFQRLTAIEQDKKRKLQQELSEKLN